MTVGLYRFLTARRRSKNNLEWPCTGEKKPPEGGFFCSGSNYLEAAAAAASAAADAAASAGAAAASDAIGAGAGAGAGSAGAATGAGAGAGASSVLPQADRAAAAAITAIRARDLFICRYLNLRKTIFRKLLMRFPASTKRTPLTRNLLSPRL